MAGRADAKAARATASEAERIRVGRATRGCHCLALRGLRALSAVSAEGCLKSRFFQGHPVTVISPGGRIEQRAEQRLRRGGFLAKLHLLLHG